MRRALTAYRLTPVHGLSEPTPDIPVHFMTGEIALACRTRSAGMRLKTSSVKHVTCPKCLRRLQAPL